MSKRTKTYLIIGGAAVVGFMVLSKIMAAKQTQVTGSAALLQGEYTPAKGVAYFLASSADAVKNVMATIGNIGKTQQTTA